MPATTEYILYVRKSTDTEDRQVQSLDDQEAELKALARRLNLKIRYEFTEARSAKAPDNRPVFAEMVKLLKQGKAQGILCWHLNRLSRNPVDSGTLSWLLQKEVIRSIRTIDREYLPTDNVLLFAVESGKANQDLIELKNGIKRGIEGKVRRGVYPYHAKPGYQVDGRSRDHVPDPVRFPLLRRAWDLMLTGSYTGTEALRELNSWGYRTVKGNSRGGTPLACATFYNMLGDRFYCGFFKYMGELVKGTHTPMVSPEEFARVQGFLGRDLREKPEKHLFAYTGLASCGLCGSAVTAEVKTKQYRTTGRTQRYVYYHCTGRNKCPKLSITGDRFEADLKAYLASCRLSPKYVEWALEALRRDFAARRDTDQAIREQQAELEAELTKRLDRLNDLYLSGDYTAEEYRPLKAKYLSELNEVRFETERIEDKEERTARIAENILTFSRDAFDRLSGGDVRDKREVARLFAVSYVLTLGKLDFLPDPRLDRIRAFEPQNLPPQRIEKGGSTVVNPVWYSLLDSLLTSIGECDRDFPALSERDTSDPDGEHSWNGTGEGM